MTATFGGAYVALVTPFDADGNVDEAAYRNLIEHCIGGGVDGLVPCGTTGEKSTLTVAEHQRVIELAIEAAAGRVKIIAGTGSNDTAHAAMMAKFAREAGADAALSVTPYYNKPTQEGLKQHYFKIAEVAEIPVIVYNVPGRTSVNLKPGTLVDLWSHPLIAGVKDASGNVEYVMELFQAGMPDDFTLLSGDDSLTLPKMLMGGHGCISVVANEMPEDFAKMVHLAQEGKWREARAHHNRMYVLMNMNFIETNPLPVKTALAMMGLIEENFRLPLCEMSRDNKSILRAHLEGLGLI